MSSSSPFHSKKANGSIPSAMKVIMANFRSIKNKREEVNNITEQFDLNHVNIGTGTWLHPSTNSSEYFPCIY
jgi:acetolactate synthase small subunit